jgi:hypothetical protein
MCYFVLFFLTEAGTMFPFLLTDSWNHKDEASATEELLSEYFRTLQVWKNTSE